MLQPKTGYFCKFYRGTGTIANPVWVEWGEINEVTCSGLTRNKTPLNLRAMPFTPSLRGRIGELTFEGTYFPGFNQNNYDTLTTSFFADEEEPVLWAMMDGDITKSGTQGLVMAGWVEGIPYNQPIDDAVTHDFTIAGGLMRESGSSQDGTSEWVKPTWMTVA